jgi:hypothetical protein
MYGAGVKPFLLLISSNSSSGTLNEHENGGSSEAAQNILSPTENTRSFPHFTSSVTARN